MYLLLDISVESIGLEISHLKHRLHTDSNRKEDERKRERMVKSDSIQIYGRIVICINYIINILYGMEQ